MKGRWRLIVLGLAVAVIAHVAMLQWTPRLSMRALMDSVGGATTWSDTQQSPRRWQNLDIVTRHCVVDLSEGPARIRVARWRDYWSLTLYDDAGRAFFLINDREAPRGATVLVSRRAEPSFPPDAFVARAPSDRILAVVRRLAPSRTIRGAAAQAAADDECGFWRKDEA